jgi:membrane protein YqaA with SNARE-associated domain
MPHIARRLRWVLLRALRSQRRTRGLPAWLGVLAFLATVTVMVPVSTLVMLTALLQPRRWVASALWASAGASVGGMLIVMATTAWGLPFIEALLPEWLPKLDEVRPLIAQWGVWGLAALAATPLPQTPALLLWGLLGLGGGAAGLSLLLGKLLKYSLVAAASARIPGFFGLDRRRRWRRGTRS